jgi:hypothetical protein
VRQIDINRGTELADELIEKLWEESENAAELLSSVAVAIRRMQGYNDYLLLSLNGPLRRMPVREEES